MKYVVHQETINGIHFVIKYNEAKGYHYIIVDKTYTVVVFKSESLDEVYEELKEKAEREKLLLVS